MSRIAVFSAKSVSLLIAAVIVVAAGFAWGTTMWLDSKFVQVEALDENSPDIKRPEAQRDTENFLIVGSDSRAGDNAALDKTRVSGARSDTVMIAHIPADRRRVVVVSFPRDLEVTRPACTRWNSATGAYTTETVPAAAQVKLNTAYAFGGPRCVTKLIQQLTGIRMNHFAGIDFSGFQRMVDAVGGVPMHVSAPVIDKYQGTVVARPGTITFDGERALRFVRSRTVQGDPTSDYGRIKRQQQVISALLGTALSREVVLDSEKLGSFVTAFADTTVGENIDVTQLLTLAQSMNASEDKRVTFLTVPTTGGANTRGNEVLLEGEASALFTALIDNAPLPKGLVS